MGQQATLVVFDGAPTPLTHALIGAGVEKVDGVSLALYKESLPTVPDGAQLRVTLSKRKLRSGMTRVGIRGELSVMESISGVNASGYTAAQKVAHVVSGEYAQYSHDRSTSVERRLIRQLVLNVSGGIATSVTPVTSGPGPELVDQLIQVT